MIKYPALALLLGCMSSSHALSINLTNNSTCSLELIEKKVFAALPSIEMPQRISAHSKASINAEKLPEAFAFIAVYNCKSSDEYLEIAAYKAIDDKHVTVAIYDELSDDDMHYRADNNSQINYQISG